MRGTQRVRERGDTEDTGRGGGRTAAAGDTGTRHRRGTAGPPLPPTPPPVNAVRPARCRSGGAVPSAPALTGSAAALGRRRSARPAPPRPAAARPPPAPRRTRRPARGDTPSPAPLSVPEEGKRTDYGTPHPPRAAPPGKRRPHRDHPIPQRRDGGSSPPASVNASPPQSVEKPGTS